MAYFVGCASASLTIAIVIAVRGMFMRGSARILINEIIPSILFTFTVTILPILLLALPGFAVMTLVFATFKLQYAALHILGWALNGAVAYAVLASIGDNSAYDGVAISLIFLFAVAGAVGGAVAWAVRSKTELEYWETGR